MQKFLNGNKKYPLNEKIKRLMKDSKIIKYET